MQARSHLRTKCATVSVLDWSFLTSGHRETYNPAAIIDFSVPEQNPQ
jgi:hypothetical protein